MFVSVEHTIYLASALVNNKIQFDNCKSKADDFWENYVARERPHLYRNFPYYLFEVPLYEVS